MTLPKDKKINHEHIESMKIAVDESDIRSIHPDKMEEFVSTLSKRQGQTNDIEGQKTLFFMLFDK